MSWGKAEEFNGGYHAHKEGNGDLYSGQVDHKGYIDRNNHIHLHNDGVTVTHDGHKTTVYKDHSRN